jgi:Flp pilus assembly protein TadD
MNTELEDKILYTIQSEQLDRAREYILEGFKEGYDLSKLLMYLAFVYEKNYEVAKAMRHYRASLDIDGTNEIALYNLYRLGDSSRNPIRYR